MSVNQIAVFLENRKGTISDFTRALKSAGVNLVTMSIADTTEFGILRAITSDNKKAVAALNQAGFTVTTSELVGVEVEDKPGALFGTLDVLDENGVDIEYLYSFTNVNGKAVILFKVADVKKTEEIVRKNGIKLYSEE